MAIACCPRTNQTVTKRLINCRKIVLGTEEHNRAVPVGIYMKTRAISLVQTYVNTAVLVLIQKHVLIMVASRDTIGLYVYPCNPWIYFEKAVGCSLNRALVLYACSTIIYSL